MQFQAYFSLIHMTTSHLRYKKKEKSHINMHLFKFIRKTKLLILLFLVLQERSEITFGKRRDYTYSFSTHTHTYTSIPGPKTSFSSYLMYIVLGCYIKRTLLTQTKILIYEFITSQPVSCNTRIYFQDF